MRKMRKQPVGPFNPRNFDLEPGDRVFTPHRRGQFIMYDLTTSNGWGRRNAGVLYPRLVKKDGKARIAVRRNDTWYWKV